MEFARRTGLKLLPKIAVLGAILLALFLVGHFSGYLRTDCLQDKPCFDEKLKDCRPAQVTVVKNNNAYLYQVGSSLGGTCEVNIKLLKVEAGAAPEFRTLLEGKEMQCKIPKDKVKDMQIDEFDNLLQYCHGELKEGLYELIIQRMYEYMVSQLDEVIVEAQKVLREV